MSFLCHVCFGLTLRGEEWVLCTSERCRNVPDIESGVRPLVMDPRSVPSLKTLWGRRVKLDVPCPGCGGRGTLRYACPRCRRQLPDMQREDDLIVAVLGATEAGKTHYLATLYHMLVEAPPPDQRRDWEVVLEESQHKWLREQLWQPLFVEHQELERTPPAVRTAEVGLVLRHLSTGRRVKVTFMDLSGGVLVDSRLAREDLLHHATGVILLADPITLRDVPKPRWANRATYRGLPTCGQILGNYLRIVEERARSIADPKERKERRLLPEQKILALVVAKADLAGLDPEHPFWRSEGAGDVGVGFWQRRSAENLGARQWLLARADANLAGLAAQFADSAYFFVSSYGYKHVPETKVKQLRPRRVEEPLFAILDRVADSMDKLAPRSRLADL